MIIIPTLPIEVINDLEQVYDNVVVVGSVEEAYSLGLTNNDILRCREKIIGSVVIKPVYYPIILLREDSDTIIIDYNHTKLWDNDIYKISKIIEDSGFSVIRRPYMGEVKVISRFDIIELEDPKPILQYPSTLPGDRTYTVDCGKCGGDGFIVLPLSYERIDCDRCGGNGKLTVTDKAFVKTERFDVLDTYEENPFTLKNIIRFVKEYEELADEELEELSPGRPLRTVDKLDSYNNYLIALGLLRSLTYKERHIPFIKMLKRKIETKAVHIEAEIERLYKEHTLLDIDYRRIQQKYESKPIEGISRFDVIEPM